MISGLVVDYKINVQEQFSGLDHPDRCVNKKHFENYPWQVDYFYNRWGLRDDEWPQTHDDLQKAVWCIGDSFTVGVGQPFEHIWPQKLSKRIDLRTINVSKDGASNGWISRAAIEIISKYQPKNIVIMWSYLHRRPHMPNSLPDPKHILTQPNWKQCYDRKKLPGQPECHSLADFRKLPQDTQDFVIAQIGEEAWTRDLTKTQHFIRSTNEDDIDYFTECVNLVETHRTNTNIIHAVIPGFAPRDWISRAMQVLQACCHIPYTEQLDTARDGHHFDCITADWITEEIVPHLIFLIASGGFQSRVS